ncbi:cubilin-like isoform X2 [Paramacrobiotus metropolitanus]|uniref:cubilin-like isoform X2 n=1 Tax=Paramacrobiotus metropolitanus TaxID=2943436 RepID=UPI0024457FBB|nr:cubilin-like isoform X2 [Paramacrobiotus metropolitanus]
MIALTYSPQRPKLHPFDRIHGIFSWPGCKMTSRWLLLMCTAAMIVENSLLVFATAASGEVLLCGAPQNIESSPRIHWGYIASPNHAGSYKGKAHLNRQWECMFKFLPKADEQIQLTFTYFNLRESDTSRINPNASEHGNLIGEYCGRKQPEAIMAVGPTPLTVFFTVRIMERHDIFHASLPYEQWNGMTYFTYRRSPRSLYMFKAKYTFRKDYGLTKTAAQHNRTAGCHFVYDGRRVPATGTFESPNFGGYYPFSTNCIYTFRTFNNQSLQLRFSTFEVAGQKDRSCRGKGDDTLQIKEGEHRYDWTDFAAPAENDPAKREPTSNLYCGYKSPPQFNSTSKVVYVIFKSGLRRTNLGFQGTYAFFGHPGIYLPDTVTAV